jgi:hypothetical protein
MLGGVTTKETKKNVVERWNHKRNKENKRHKKNVIESRNHKRNKEKEKTKKNVVGRRNHKKTKQSGCVGVLNALARIATKAPKLKKPSFAGKKERPKEAPFYTRKTRFLNKGLEGKAEGGY